MWDKLAIWFKGSCVYQHIGDNVFGKTYECNVCEYCPDEISLYWMYCPQCGRKIMAFED